MKNIYCKSPWLSAYYNYDLKIITPCSRSCMNIEEMRKNFINNIIPENCKNCDLKYLYEKKEYQDYFLENIKFDTYNIIEFSGILTKYCNYKCRTCYYDKIKEYNFFDILEEKK